MLCVSLDIVLYKDKMIIALLCLSLIGPYPNDCHLKPNFSFPVADI